MGRDDDDGSELEGTSQEFAEILSGIEDSLDNIHAEVKRVADSLEKIVSIEPNSSLPLGQQPVAVAVGNLLQRAVEGMGRRGGG